MAANMTKPGPDGKKFTTKYNLKEAKSIIKEVQRRKDADEHGATSTAVLRDLVRTGLPS